MDPDFWIFRIERTKVKLTTPDGVGISDQNQQISSSQFDSYRRGVRLYHNQTSIRLVDEIGNTIIESAYVWPSPTFAFAIILQLASDSAANWIYTPRPGKYLWHGEMLNTPGAIADVRKA